jgi:hypothetical protein
LSEASQQARTYCGLPSTPRIALPDVGGVEQRDAPVDRTLNQLNALRLGGAAAGVEIGQPHAAEPDFGHLQSLAAELA